MPGFVNYKKGCTRLTAISDKVYHLHAHSLWFSLGTPASSTTKTDCLDKAKILLKVALNTINQIKSNVFTEMPQYLSPFVTNEQSESARCFQPGEMDESEVIEFPEFSKVPTVYLAIRNVCVTLWNLNPKVNNECIGLIKSCDLRPSFSDVRVTTIPKWSSAICMAEMKVFPGSADFLFFNKIYLEIKCYKLGPNS